MSGEKVVVFSRVLLCLYHSIDSHVFGEWFQVRAFLIPIVDLFKILTDEDRREFVMAIAGAGLDINQAITDRNWDQLKIKCDSDNLDIAHRCERWALRLNPDLLDESIDPRIFALRGVYSRLSVPRLDYEFAV